MSLLNLFNKAASKTSGYLKFDDLTPGSYAVKKFSLMKKSSFGGKVKLRMVHLKSGYLILPSRMSEDFANAHSVNKLNKRRYKFVFIGKDKDKKDRVEFKLEKNTEPDTEDEFTDDDEDSSASEAEVAKDEAEDEPKVKKAKSS